MEKDYASSYAMIPDNCLCAACGLWGYKEQMERHHPAGRRKDAFLFTVMLHSACHRRTHLEPSWGKERGLLLDGRNSKELTIEVAEQLMAKNGRNITYPIEILKRYAKQKPQEPNES